MITRQNFYIITRMKLLKSATYNEYIVSVFYKQKKKINGTIIKLHY